MSLLQEHIPNLYHHSFISALTTRSHITSHYGPTNKKLRFHLPLVGVSGSRMRVGE
jgi:aspartate beta-hydroxylase